MTTYKPDAGEPVEPTGEELLDRYLNRCDTFYREDCIEIFREGRAFERAARERLGPLCCSRCGANVTGDYMRGSCYDEQGEPQEFDVHDQAEPEAMVWDAKGVHGLIAELRSARERKRGERPTGAELCELAYRACALAEDDSLMVRYVALFDAGVSWAESGDSDELAKLRTDARLIAEQCLVEKNAKLAARDELAMLRERIAALTEHNPGEYSAETLATMLSKAERDRRAAERKLSVIWGALNVPQDSTSEETIEAMGRMVDPHRQRVAELEAELKAHDEAATAAESDRKRLEAELTQTKVRIAELEQGLDAYESRMTAECERAVARIAELEAANKSLGDMTLRVQGDLAEVEHSWREEKRASSLLRGQLDKRCTELTEASEELRLMRNLEFFARQLNTRRFFPESLKALDAHRAKTSGSAVAGGNDSGHPGTAEPELPIQSPSSADSGAPAKPRPGFATAAELADVVRKVDRLESVICAGHEDSEYSIKQEIRAEREARKL